VISANPLTGLTTDLSTNNQGVWVEPASDIDYSDMQLFWQYDLDSIPPFNPFEGNAVISIYVGIIPGHEDLLYYQDSQYFMVVVQTEDGDYLLLPKENVFLSSVIVSAYTDRDMALHVMVEIRASSLMRITDFIYDADNKTFTEVQLINDRGINLLMQSPSLYSYPESRWNNSIQKILCTK
jgi:hypothetical protein